MEHIHSSTGPSNREILKVKAPLFICLVVIVTAANYRSYLVAIALVCVAIWEVRRQLWDIFLPIAGHLDEMEHRLQKLEDDLARKQGSEARLRREAPTLRKTRPEKIIQR